MNPEVRPIDGLHLLIRAKHDIEALMKLKEETVEVDLTIFHALDFNNVTEMNSCYLYTVPFCLKYTYSNTNINFQCAYYLVEIALKKL